jgi:hypothetical protein
MQDLLRVYAYVRLRLVSARVTRPPRVLSAWHGCGAHSFASRNRFTSTEPALYALQTSRSSRTISSSHLPLRSAIAWQEWQTPGRVAKAVREVPYSSARSGEPSLAECRNY